MWETPAWRFRPDLSWHSSPGEGSGRGQLTEGAPPTPQPFSPSLLHPVPTCPVFLISPTLCTLISAVSLPVPCRLLHLSPKPPMLADPTLAQPGRACVHMSQRLSTYLGLSRPCVPSLHPRSVSESSVSADIPYVHVTHTSTRPQRTPSYTLGHGCARPAPSCWGAAHDAPCREGGHARHPHVAHRVPTHSHTSQAPRNCDPPQHNHSRGWPETRRTRRPK